MEIMQSMGIERGRIEIHANTNFNSAQVKLTKYHTRTDNGEEVFISETRSL